MGLLYTAQYLLVLVALALVGQSTSALVGVRTVPWSALCATMTPHVLASVVLAIAWLWPGAPPMAFLLLPGLAAIVVLLFLCKHIGPFARTIAKPFGKRHFNWVVVVVCGLLALLCARLVLASSAPITGHDALIYLTEAKAFAGERAISAIPDYDAGIGEVVKTHPHQFLWQAYIAQALMATNGAIGFPNDTAARMAIFATLPLLVIAATALARIVLPTWTALLALPLTLLIMWIGYVPSSGSIDAFRIIPFIGATSLVVILSGQKTIAQSHYLLFISIYTFYSSISHTINLLFLTILFGSLFPLSIFRIVTWRNFFFVGEYAFIGIIPTIVYFSRNWIHYGNPLGLGFDYYFYRGTPLWEGFSRQRSWVKPQNMLSAIQSFAKLHGLAFATTSFSVSLLSLFSGIVWQTYERVLTLAVIFLMLALLPLIPLGSGVTLQGAVLSNARYGLQTFVLAPAMISGVLCFVLARLSPFLNQRKFIAKLLPATLSLLVSLMALRAVFEWQLASSAQAMKELEERELFVASYADRLKSGANWAVDRYTVAYFADRLPIKLTSMVGSPLLQAQTTKAVAQQLDAFNIRMVALYIPDWWDNTALFETLNSGRGVERHVSGYWRIFVLPANVQSWASLLTD